MLRNAARPRKPPTEPPVRLVLAPDLRVGDRIMYPLPDLRITGVVFQTWPCVEMKVEYALRPSGTPVVAKCGGRRTLPDHAQCVLLSRSTMS